MHRNAIIDYVQVVLFEVNDPFPAGVFHVGIADIPLLRHGPIKYLSSAGNLMHVQRDFSPYAGKRLAESLARNTAADWIKITDEGIDFVPEGGALENREKANEILGVGVHS